MTAVTADAWEIADPTGCHECGREACEEHIPYAGFPLEELQDGVDVAQRGRDIDAAGIKYVLGGIIPSYGMLGFLVAYAKVGKTTFGQVLASHVAMGRSFLERDATPTRVLVIAAEDPPEYTAWLARHLNIDRGRMTFRCMSIVLDPKELRRVIETVKGGGYGLVLISSWQAVVRGLIKDENDNAGAVQVVENVKAAARETGIPWLIDAHSGKGEDQQDEADPSKAMRGASAAAGAADYTLSLRYADGAFGSRRKLSGKGRFVSVAPIVMEFEPATSSYTVLAETKDATRECTWRLICETGAVGDVENKRTAGSIARPIGLGKEGETPSGAQSRKVGEALRGREGVASETTQRGGRGTTTYWRCS